MNSNKPLVSLVIAFYNQENFVEDAVKGALSQTYDNLEIILSDDCSTDKTFEVIRKCTRDYVGPHKITINRNQHNLGLVPHVNKILYELSYGEYIFISGGDDISLSNRVEEGVKYFVNDKSISAITSALIYIDGNGHEFKRMNLDKDIRYNIKDNSYLSRKSFMCGLGMLALKREVLELFGPLNDDCQTEDSCLRFRALLVGDVVASAQYGVKYRVHGKNISIGTVVYRLKTHPIARQYKRDLDVVKNKIPQSLYMVLKKKIVFFEVNRETAAVLTLPSSKLKRIAFRIKRKIINYLFKKEIKKYQRENV